MQIIPVRLLTILSLLFLSGLLPAWAQIPGSPCSPLFVAPDTVCIGQWIEIEPGIQSGSNFHWSFCSPDAGEPPLASSLGNPSGEIDNPRYVSLVKDGSECYAFLTNSANSSIIRIYFGDSFNNAPVSTVNLGSMYLLTNNIRGIQVLNENGIWTGYVVNGSNLYQFYFQGNTLSGPPIVIDNIPLPGIVAASGLIIEILENEMVGFITDSQLNKLVRLKFQTGLTAPPVVDTLGNIGGLDSPAGMSLLKWNGYCYLFIANEGNSTVSRIDFGLSFNGAPSGTNLGNINGQLDNCTGIAMKGECDEINGYMTNRNSSVSGLIRLQFPDGPEGPPAALPLGNPGGLNEPFGFPGLTRSRDTIFSLIPNIGDNTITRLTFPACSASSSPGDQKMVPDPFFYLETGKWNIWFSYLDSALVMHEQCHPVVVIPELQVSLGPDRTVCEGDSTLLDAGSGYAGYLWSTGDTGQTVWASSAGEFRVTVYNSLGCEANDTVQVTTTGTIEVTVDTILCHGEKYWAGGAWQTSPGTFRDTAMAVSGCDSITITDLGFKARIPVELGSDFVICPGDQVLLHATVPGASYWWQDGSTDSLFLVTAPGQYRVEVTFDGCMEPDSVTAENCPVRIWFPTAFTPDGDGLNDTYRPKGISVGRFRMVIFDRWGQQLFETDSMENGWNGEWNGNVCPTGTYSFVSWYDGIETPGQTETTRGTFTLVR